MPNISKPPSEYLADGRVVISCEAERHLAHALAGLGDHAVVFASDYPHWDAEFPNSVRAITDRTDLDDQQKDAILGANAARVYQWADR
jgi:predicted TIM-barrel fold metal-dependent hydrolase